MANDSFVLEVVEVCKNFGVTKALIDVRLHAKAGEIVCLVGENGSGKSTLAKIIAGLIEPDRGVMRIDDSSYTPDNPRDARAWGVGYLGQEPSVVPGMTVAENIGLSSYGGRPWWRRRHNACMREAESTLESIGFEHLDVRAQVSGLNAADLPIIELAKNLTGPTHLKVLILDEVTTRMPDVSRLFSVVRTLASTGISVIMITHRYAEIAEIADRVVVLRDGRLAGEVARTDLSEARLTRLMTGRDIDLFPKRNARAEGLPPALALRGLISGRDAAARDFHLGQGEIVGLAGLVGSGRSSVLERIYGVRARGELVVEVAGRVLSDQAVSTSIDAGVGFVPEDRMLQGLMVQASIASNLLLGPLGLLSWTSNRKQSKSARPYLEAYRVKASSVLEPVASLSGGNAQKVVVARALRSGSRCLLLDEPTRGVDIGARADIYQMIDESTERGVGVLLASSDLSELVGLCDRVLVMHDGHIVGELSGNDISESAIVSLSMGAARVQRSAVDSESLTFGGAPISQV